MPTTSSASSGRRRASIRVRWCTGRPAHDSSPTEETLCYLAPKPLLLELIRRNAGFAAFFYSELSRKLASYARRQETDDVGSVLRARVRDAKLRPAVFIDGDDQHRGGWPYHAPSATTMRCSYATDDRIGIVTGMNLSKAVVLDRRPLDTPVREICHFDVSRSTAATLSSTPC